MWIQTTLGFFSIVEKASDRATGTLTVRARVRADLEQLRDRHLPGMSAIEEGAGTDYAFRATAPRAEVAGAIASLVSRIDYGNFKDAVAIRQGNARAKVYASVWSALARLQSGQGAGKVS